MNILQTAKKHLLPISLSASMFYVTSALAAVYDGPGIDIDNVPTVNGLTNTDPRAAILAIIRAILNYLGLIAVVMIIIAGLYLILSFGNEENKDKAKRIIIYTLIGLIVILFARVIVGLVTVFLVQEI